VGLLASQLDLTQVAHLPRLPLRLDRSVDGHRVASLTAPPVDQFTLLRIEAAAKQSTAPAGGVLLRSSVCERQVPVVGIVPSSVTVVLKQGPIDCSIHQ